MQQHINSAMQSLAPNFKNIEDQILVLKNDRAGMDVEPQPSMEARRQDILNESLRESQRALRDSLRDRYAREQIAVSEAELESIVLQKGVGVSSSKDSVQRMRVEDLPKFDGKNVYNYVVSVSSAILQFGQVAVAQTIPRTFKGQARHWWNILPEDVKTMYMSNVHRFKDALEEEFSDSVGVAKDKAKSRSWKIGSEDIMSYYYDKIDLMVATNHGNHSEVEICYELREGLPAGFRPYIRTILEKNPSTHRIRKEFQSLENDFMKMWGNQRKFTPPMTPSTTMSPASSPESSRSSPPVFRRGRTEPPLRESYDPKKIGQAEGPDGKMLRSYTLPSGQVILLNRTCRVSGCNGNHFDFEHDHLTTRKRAASVPASQFHNDSYEGYPLAGDPIVEEASEDEDESIDQKLLSYTMFDDDVNDHSPVRRFAKQRGTKN